MGWPSLLGGKMEKIEKQILNILGNAFNDMGDDLYEIISYEATNQGIKLQEVDEDDFIDNETLKDDIMADYIAKILENDVEAVLNMVAGALDTRCDRLMFVSSLSENYLKEIVEALEACDKLILSNILDGSEANLNKSIKVIRESRDFFRNFDYELVHKAYLIGHEYWAFLDEKYYTISNFSYRVGSVYNPADINDKIEGLNDFGYIARCAVHFEFKKKGIYEEGYMVYFHKVDGINTASIISYEKIAHALDCHVKEVICNISLDKVNAEDLAERINYITRENYK